MNTHDNYFIEISKNMPKENYFTNCFAFLLRKDKRFFNKFISLVFKKNGNNIKNDGNKVIGIETQKNFVCTTQGIIDIDILTEDFRIIIENKIDTGISDTQIKNYFNYINHIKNTKSNKNVVFVLITKHDINEKTMDFSYLENFVYLKWSEILNILKTDSSNKTREKFIEFMRWYDMEEFEGFKKMEYGNIWNETTNFLKSVEALMKIIKKKMAKNEFGWNPRQVNEFDQLGFHFLSKKYKWKFYYEIIFEIIDDRAEFTVGFMFQKTFREALRTNNETYNMTTLLNKKGFDVEWDRDMIYKSIDVREIAKYKKHEQQVNHCLNFIEECIRDIEKVGLLELCKKTFKTNKF